MSYEAIICELAAVRPHPNADRLKLATVFGNQIVVGLDAEDGDLGIFFATDGQLSEEYANANDLIRRKDAAGNNAGGMFDPNRKVRAQRLRGEKSDGFWAVIDTLAFAGDVDELKHGHKLDTFNGVKICQKYFTPATLRAMSQGGRRKRQNSRFAKHVETDQFRTASIPDGSLITITEKIHGTSHRVGNVLDDLPEPGRVSRFLNSLFKRNDPTTKFTVIHGTRNVILEDPQTMVGHHGPEDFRHNSTEHFANNLRKGEVVYGEIVGFTPGAPIMSPQSVSKDLKEVRKTYSETMVYSYGNPEGSCDFYVYRITQVDVDGHATELSWNQVKARALELGIKIVPEVVDQTIGRKADIESMVESLMEGPSTLDHSHIREGVVVRVDSPDGRVQWFKAKSFIFGVLEGYMKADDSFVDLEEVS